MRVIDGRFETDRAAQLTRRARWLPAILIAAGAVFYWFSPPGLTSSPFFESAPLIAAALLTLRGTVIVAVSALVVNIGLELANGTADQPEAIIEMISQLVIGAISCGINTLVRRNSQRLATVRNVALAAQRAVLPTPPEVSGGLRIAASYLAADADARIGGDIYAVQDCPAGVRAIVGDVRGKGLDAVESVAVVIGSFREAAEQEDGLEGLARRLEHALQRAGAAPGEDRFEGFTTAVLAEVDEPEGRLLLVNRGHPPPILLSADGAVRSLAPKVPALPLGMGDLGTWPDEVLDVPFPPGATLLLFTDGVTEARDRAGEFYDPYLQLRGRTFAGPDELLDALLEDVTRHTGGEVADDMALMAITRQPGEEQSPAEQRSVHAA